MFYGHLGVALAAKPVIPKVSTGVLIFTATLADVMCGIFTLLGLEGIDTRSGASSIPYSHGLFMSLVWAILFAAISYLVTRNMKVTVITALLFFSHWILDFISHPMGMGKILPPDLPLMFNHSPRVGLGLYQSLVAALITEFSLLVAGIIIFLRSTKSADVTGKWSFALLILLLALFPLSMFLPPALAVMPVFFTLLLLPLGIWMDRHRVSTTSLQP